MGNEYRGKPDSYKRSGAEFTVCCGVSGIGKTAFSTDGLHILAEKLNETTKPAQLLKDCIKRNLIFRLSFVDHPLEQVEKSNPSIILPYRVLHQYFDSTKGISNYSTFVEINYPKFGNALTLKDVCDFILSKGKSEQKEQLVIVHIDEAQNLDMKDGLFCQIVQCLWNVRNSVNSLTHLFPILSGTSALGLHSLFASSSYIYKSLDLPLLQKSHMVKIAQSITSKKAKSNLNEESLLAKVMHIATEGHPRLQKAFVSVGSSLHETNQKISKSAIAPFFRDGYSKLLEKQDNPENVWKIVDETSSEVERDQFPEQTRIQSAGLKLI
jgi:hypothetical protein